MPTWSWWIFNAAKRLSTRSNTPRADGALGTAKNLSDGRSRHLWEATECLTLNTVLRRPFAAINLGLITNAVATGQRLTGSESHRMLPTETSRASE